MDNILIKDGVKYIPYKFKKETGNAQYEEIVLKHYKEIFGENSILFPKKKIKTISGVGSIPDAFVISLDETKWYVVEVELSTHEIYNHIVPQITKFQNAIKQNSTLKNIKNFFYDGIKSDPKKIALFQEKGIGEIHKSVSDILDSDPEIIIIIDENTKELDQVCSTLHIKKPIVFKTFKKNVSENVFIHQFNSLDQALNNRPKKIQLYKQLSH